MKSSGLFARESLLRFVSGLLLAAILGLTACSAQNPDAEDASGVTTEDEFEIDAGTESEPESKDGSGDVGSRANPIPRGTEAAIGPDWRVKVLGTEANANERIRGENSFNDPPPAGGQFYLATVELTYVGEGSSSPIFDVSFKAVGQSNVTYDRSANSCGVIPSPLPDNEIFSGGKISGNVCWATRSDDTDSLLMVVDVGLINQSRGFFALK